MSPNAPIMDIHHEGSRAWAIDASGWRWAIYRAYRDPLDRRWYCARDNTGRFITFRDTFSQGDT